MGGVEIALDAEVFAGVDDVDQMVRDLGLLFWRRLGSADVHAAVDGHRVERDDLGIELPGEGEADLRFSARR